MMNKTFTFLFSVLLLGTYAFAQDDEQKSVEVSIRLSPIISMPRVIDDSKDWDFNKAGTFVKFSGGLSTDFFLQDNIAFSTGLWYTQKRSNMTVTTSLLANTEAKLDYNLQYIEFPFLFKGFTNNITEKMKIYFQLGATFGIKVDERYAGDINDKPSDATYSKWYDSGILLGSGLELNVGTSNKFYVGLDYSQGLTNIIKDDYIQVSSIESPSSNSYKVKNNYLALVLGFKF